MAGRQMERARQPGNDAVARHRAREQVGHAGTEARADGVQDGELPPRIAREDIQQIEQPAERAVGRIEKIVGGIERGVRRIDHPGLQFEALEDAVARQAALRIIEPHDERDQYGTAADHEQCEIGERSPGLSVPLERIGKSQDTHPTDGRLRPRRLRQDGSARTIPPGNKIGRMACIE